MKSIYVLLLVSLVSLNAFAQDEKDEEEVKTKGFKKENLFTGGSVTVSLSNYITTLGASPVFGYSITKWLDAGFVANFLYASNRHVLYGDGYNYYYSNDKQRQTIYGPGAFIKIYPVKFLFVQAQGEINYIREKIIYANGGGTEKYKYSAPSLLIGAGYASGRQEPGDIFYYVSLLFDVAKDKNSPYVEQVQSGSTNVLPIIRAGLQIPLFQGQRYRGVGVRRKSRF